MQVVAEVPAQAEAIGGPHELTFRPNALEKHDELELEKDDGVNGGSSQWRIAVLDQITNKGEVECTFRLAVEVILQDEIIEGDVVQRPKQPDFDSHATGALSDEYAALRYDREASFQPVTGLLTLSAYYRSY